MRVRWPRIPRPRVPDEAKGPLRLLVGLAASVVLVLASSYEQASELNGYQIDGCHRSAERSIAQARKAAADATREFALADLPDEPAKAEHALSAGESMTAARELLRLAGLEEFGYGGTRAVLKLRLSDPAVRDAIDATCDRNYPRPKVVPF